MSLARSEENQQRFYSLSAQIIRDRNSDYYDILEQTQKGERDITSYLEWFIGCFSRALKEADRICTGVLRKAEFWQLHADKPINERPAEPCSGRVRRQPHDTPLGQHGAMLTANRPTGHQGIDRPRGPCPE